MAQNTLLYSFCTATSCQIEICQTFSCRHVSLPVQALVGGRDKNQVSDVFHVVQVTTPPPPSPFPLPFSAGKLRGKPTKVCTMTKCTA